MTSKLSLEKSHGDQRETEESTSVASLDATEDLQTGCENQTGNYLQSSEVDEVCDGDLEGEAAAHDGGAREMVCPEDEHMGAIGGNLPVIGVQSIQEEVRAVEKKSMETQIELDGIQKMLRIHRIQRSLSVVYDGDLEGEDAAHDVGAREMVCPEDEHMGAIGGNLPVIGVQGMQVELCAIEYNSMKTQIELDSIQEELRIRRIPRSLSAFEGYFIFNKHVDDLGDEQSLIADQIELPSVEKKYSGEIQLEKIDSS